MRYYLDPFGCVKNQVDAETMMAHLNGASWLAADKPEDADLIIINSCGFIESAKRESINAVLAWRKLFPDKKLILAGCLAQRYADEIELAEADCLFGNNDLAQITEVASRLTGSAAAGTPVVPGQRPLLSLPGSAYIKISEGCNNRCSFCAIPLIRGPLRSRPIPDIVEECRQLIARGIRELCLIGQDIGSFGKTARDSADSQLPALLEAITRLDGQFWVRLLYIHPDQFPLDILDTISRDKRFLPYFDLPFQHGSTLILRAMNRQGNAESYLSLIRRIRDALPDATLRSTFLLGFPGETSADFHALLDFQAEARLDWVGCFTYSREENTPAYSMKNRVSKRLAAERKALIEERQTPISEERMERFIGRRLDALVEEALDPEEGLYLGRLFCQAPEVDGATVITSNTQLTVGDFVTGKIVARAGIDLDMRV
ncbi:MAG: 30S ribosomal protein S12 methylthiotransferase RimO [Treponema sp.]|nr:30S ribosomal protein S12 methylthiotransferase RimO [Treponema sp.]